MNVIGVTLDGGPPLLRIHIERDGATCAAPSHWGGTFGACTTAVQQILADGGSVAHAHLRYLNPLPRNLGDLLERHEKVLVPELNLGQLNFILRANFLKETVSFNKVEGRPFTVSELVDKINNLL